MSDYDPKHLDDLDRKGGYQFWDWFPGARTRVVECMKAKGYQPWYGI